MSILIKGMKMPKNCYDCPFIRASYAGDYYCAMGNSTEDDLKKICGQKMADCPLVEIPAPHGRLIDADKLLEKAYWDYNEAIHDYNNFKIVSEFEIADTLTVIEAEGREVTE